MNRWQRWFGGAAAIDDAAALADFVARHSAFVAQSALFGYVKTRSGFEYFRLFDDAVFVASLNVAKWNIFAVCVGDLSVFCGAHVFRRTAVGQGALTKCMGGVVARVFDEHGMPAEAGADYARLVQKSSARVAAASWADLSDNESAFMESPQALVHWAPIADEHKRHDAAIVRNSVEFKWKATRDEFRRCLRPDAIRCRIGAGE